LTGRRDGATLAPMSESPYAIPVEDLVASARVAAADQVEVQAEPHPPEPGVLHGFLRFAGGGGGGGDADGD
jgi:hypothetical protein